MDASAFEFEDQFGEYRRCLTIPKPITAAADGFKAFEDTVAVWTLQQCIKAMQVPGRRKSSEFPGEGEEDQGPWGSCQGWMQANAAWRAAYAGGNTSLTKRSGPYQYSLVNNGRDNGSALIDGYYAARKYGFCSYTSCGRGHSCNASVFLSCPGADAARLTWGNLRHTCLRRCAARVSACCMESRICASVYRPLRTWIFPFESGHHTAGTRPSCELM